MLVLATVSTGFAMGKMQNKKAIVLADFGTTYLSALKAITTIQNEVKKDFPNIKVRMAFTSNIIRNIWHKRRHDASFMKEHGKDLEEFLNIKGPLATIADLQDEGYRTIIVQPCHIYSGEEYADLCSYINGLNAIRTIKVKYMPFVKLVVGRPALGTYGPVHDYHKDMEIGAKALANKVKFLTEGRVEIKVFPSGQLSKGLEVRSAVAKGVAEAGHTWMGYDWGEILPFNE
jgi:sirohydrochlorin cobaltochelatase